MTSIEPKESTEDARVLSRYKKKLILPLILLSLSSFVVIQMTPLLVQGATHQQPKLWQISATGVVVIVLSACFLAYAAKVIGLARGWFVLGVLFSSLVVITKFILMPRSLYSQTYHIGSGLTAWNPNNSTSYIGIAAILFFVYAIILWLAYKYYRGKVAAELPNVRSFRTVSVAAIVVILFILFAAASGGAVLLLPLFLFGPSFDYLSYAFSSGGITLVIATILAIVLSVKYLEHSSNVAVKMKSGAILAVTFWICISLLLMYHILWVVYMTVMLTIWPFKTISPSGK